MLRITLYLISLTGMAGSIIMLTTDLFGMTDFGFKAYLPFSISIYALGLVMTYLLATDRFAYKGK